MRNARTIAILTALCFATTALLAQPATTTIGAAAKKQPAVTFPHAKHVAAVKSCDTCHHTDKGLTKEKAATVKKCSACHLDPTGTVPSMREMNMQKNPFHALCVDCHKKEKKGPVACGGCHVKK